MSHALPLPIYLRHLPTLYLLKPFHYRTVNNRPALLSYYLLLGIFIRLFCITILNEGPYCEAVEVAGIDGRLAGVREGRLEGNRCVEVRGGELVRKDGEGRDSHETAIAHRCHSLDYRICIGMSYWVMLLSWLVEQWLY